MKDLTYIKNITLAVSCRMDWREPRAKVGESCLEFIVVFHVEMIMVVYRVVVEDLEKSRYVHYLEVESKGPGDRKVEAKDNSGSWFE